MQLFNEKKMPKKGKRTKYPVIYCGKNTEEKNRYSMREKYVNNKDEKMQNQKFFEKNEKRREKIIEY